MGSTTSSTANPVQLTCSIPVVIAITKSSHICSHQ